jgi:hypothetical protein
MILGLLSSECLDVRVNANAAVGLLEFHFVMGSLWFESQPGDIIMRLSAILLSPVHIDVGH